MYGYGYITFCFYIHQLMSIWVAATFWLLWIMLLWTSAQVFVWTHVFSSLGYTLSNGIVGSRNFMFNFLRNYWSFPKRLHYFIFPPATCKGSNFSIFLRRSSFWIQPSCEVVFHCGFDLHFSNDKWYWASLHVFIGNLYVFFGEKSIKTLCPFKIVLFGFLLLSKNKKN